MLLAVAACGGDDGGSGPSASTTRPEPADGEDAGGTTDDAEDGDTSDLACSVVTRDDAAALFGEPARAAQDQTPAPFGSSCFWENADADETGQVVHLLQVYVYEGEQFYDESVSPEAEPLDGVGDRAFVRVVEGVNPQVGVNALVGDRVLVLDYSTINIGVADAEKVDATTRQDELVELARAAAEAL
ncbi:MAG: hypothetical protein KatS3mg009_1233 [Acidimicrobiia bacterium]|nr:MAG: hypothetical protein KatS3mg009_1233 [Acidimicrobiia bacterium]